MIPGLQAKKYDVIISSMANTEDRARVVDFTNKYYHTGARVVMPKGFKYTGPESLKGKKIGVLKASGLQEKWAMAYLKLRCGCGGGLVPRRIPCIWTSTPPSGWIGGR